MSSLDEVQEAMHRFAAALRDFNEALRLSHNDLRARHDVVEPLWQDEAARAYHRAFDPLDDELSTYLKADAPRFERFVEQKLAQLEQYLHGDP